MQDRPTRQELLEVIAGFLRADLLPEAQGRVRYHLLVALNLLEILSREELLGEPLLEKERQSLAHLPGEAGRGASGKGEETVQGERLRGWVRQATESLCREIRDGVYDGGASRQALLRHLRAVAEAKLEVANPQFLERVRRED